MSLYQRILTLVVSCFHMISFYILLTNVQQGQQLGVKVNSLRIYVAAVAASI